ncbi:MAG: hypothetical protein JXR60_05375 [Bacteroidales bacterium]|nr:hypothetical protein [Bacteroidales bacterium]
MHQIGWNIGYVSTPIKNYIDQLSNKDLRILIPGCGNAYEGAYLWDCGFKNTFLLDISAEALKNVSNNYPQIPKSNLLHVDFFEHKEKYDLIIEQTFFCAIDPSYRTKYVEKIQELLNIGGCLVGVLFNIPLNSHKPPFGGNTDEYLNLFLQHFDDVKIETCYNSIKPRFGNEVFILIKK